MPDLHDPGVQKEENAVNYAAAAAAAANSADHWRRRWTEDAVDGPYCETRSGLVETQRRSHGPENLVSTLRPPSEVCAGQMMSRGTTTQSRVCMSYCEAWQITMPVQIFAENF